MLRHGGGGKGDSTSNESALLSSKKNGSDTPEKSKKKTIKYNKRAILFLLIVGYFAISSLLQVKWYVSTFLRSSSRFSMFVKMKKNKNLDEDLDFLFNNENDDSAFEKNRARIDEMRKTRSFRCSPSSSCEVVSACLRGLGYYSAAQKEMPVVWNVINSFKHFLPAAINVYSENYEKKSSSEEEKEEYGKLFPFSLPSSLDLKEMVQKMVELERKQARIPCFLDSLRGGGDGYPNKMFFNRRRFELTAFAMHFRSFPLVAYYSNAYVRILQNNKEEESIACFDDLHSEVTKYFGSRKNEMSLFVPVVLERKLSVLIAQSLLLLTARVPREKQEAVLAFVCFDFFVDDTWGVTISKIYFCDFQRDSALFAKCQREGLFKAAAFELAEALFQEGSPPPRRHSHLTLLPSTLELERECEAYEAFRVRRARARHQVLSLFREAAAAGGGQVAGDAGDAEREARRVAAKERLSALLQKEVVPSPMPSSMPPSSSSSAAVRESVLESQDQESFGELRKRIESVANVEVKEKLREMIRSPAEQARLSKEQAGKSGKKDKKNKARKEEELLLRSLELDDDDKERIAAVLKVKEEIIQIFKKYAPNEIRNVNAYMEKYKGKENLLLEALTKKYYAVIY